MWRNLLLSLVFIEIISCGSTNVYREKSILESRSEPGSQNNSVTRDTSNIGTPPNYQTGKSYPTESEKMVVPGKGTELIHLGLKRGELIEILGEPADEYRHDGFCLYTEMHWLPPADSKGHIEGDGIFVFLREDKAFEIRFDQTYHTSEGIDGGTTLREVGKVVDLPLFLLHPSANTATNHEDLYFLIDRDFGLAYEIAAAYKTRERHVSAIYVFRPGDDFLPWGCVDKNQTLTEIKKYPSH